MQYEDADSAGASWERARAATEVARQGREVAVVAVLMRVPLDDADDAASVLVETDSVDIPGGLVLASPEPGRAAATASRSLSASLEHLEPVLRTVKEKLVASAPEHFTVEFGVKLGGESGIILAKGTAEVNLKITMTWDRNSGESVPDGGV